LKERISQEEAQKKEPQLTS
jgi:hypothetical protein